MLQILESKDENDYLVPARPFYMSELKPLSFKHIKHM